MSDDLDVHSFAYPPKSWPSLDLKKHESYSWITQLGRDGIGVFLGMEDPGYIVPDAPAPLRLEMTGRG